MKQFQYKKESPLSCRDGGLFLFPKRVIAGEGVLSGVDKIYGDRKKAFLADRFIAQNYGGLIKGGGSFFDITFNGRVSPKEFYRINRMLEEKNINLLVAAGGGRAMDMGKFLAFNRKNMKLACVPTSAATCAAFTPVSVVYNESGEYMNTIDTVSPDCLIMDYNIFYELPAAFFAAGAVDAAAKYYETRDAVCVGGGRKNIYDDFVLRESKRIASRIKKIAKNGVPKEKKSLLRELTDINIIFAGMISCMGKYSITSWLAHALSAALTHCESAREYLHGEHVAAGLIIEEKILNGGGEGEAFEAAGALDMPRELYDMGLTKKDAPVVFNAFKKICSEEKIDISIDEKVMYNIIMKSILGQGGGHEKKE